MKNGPGTSDLIFQESGYRTDSHVGTSYNISEPLPDWSNLDFLRWICIIVGGEWLSTATSLNLKWLSGCMHDGRSSPSLKKKPKNMTNFSVWVEDMKTRCNCSKIRIVTGSLIREFEPLSILAGLIPACTRLRIGNDHCSLGSGRPSEICTFLTADKYTLLV